ncbi:hypothetical protein EMCRGX_G028461 [Ephydatia muelleri]|eukprot:Em0020g186a
MANTTTTACVRTATASVRDRATQLFVILAGIVVTKADDASTATAEQLNLIAVYLSISLPVVGVAIITASLCCHVRAARLVKVTTSRAHYPSGTAESRDTSTIHSVSNDLYTSLTFLPSIPRSTREGSDTRSTATLKAVVNDLYTSLEVPSSGSHPDLSGTLKIVNNDLYTSQESFVTAMR